MVERRLIVGMSGVSGAPLTVELLRQLHDNHPEVETHLIVTRGGEMTLAQETGVTLDGLRAMAIVYHENDAIGASIASGSFRTMGMIVVPCSMKTVAGIVSGCSDNLLLRAADVCLKERRKLVLVARETPLSTVHLRNLYEASQLGAVLTAQAVCLPEGLQVSLYGGTLPHIGAVSVVDPTGVHATAQFPGHKDGVVSGRWAKALSEAGYRPAVIIAGIHYEDLSREQIAEVVETTNDMLGELLRMMRDADGKMAACS